MFCPLLRGGTGLASLFLGLLLSAASLPAQVPQGRILNTFEGGLAYHEPFFETETMITSAKTHFRTVQGKQEEEWLKVKFWDKDGSNYSERIIPQGRGAGGPCFAQGNDMFLPSGGSFYSINRDPSVPIKWLGYTQDTLCAANDQYLVVRIKHAQDWDGILFHDRQTNGQIGRVATTLRVQQMVLRENDIVFTSRDGKGMYHFHRMAYPDFSRGNVVKMKIAAMPGAWGTVAYFGKDYAVVNNGMKEYIIRYSDPAKKGKPGTYLVNEGYYSAQWVECQGTLARWTGYPQTTFSHLEFGNGTYTLKPVGLPPGLLGSRYVSAGASSIYVTHAAAYGDYFTDANWIERLDFSPGNQLALDAPVADERDGTLRFTAKLAQPATQEVTFSYETKDFSAVAGSDYTGVTSAGGSIPVGQQEFHIDIPLTEDFTIERPESLELHITSLQGAFCDTPVATGRIRGSGARLVEEVANDTGGLVVGTLDTTTSRANGLRRVYINTIPINARELGFEGFWPVVDGGDGFRYARALPLGSNDMKFCQFDGTTGELLEVFNHAPFKAQGAELVLGKGAGFVRYSFYDGLPILSLDGITVPEGPAAKEFTVRSERTHQTLDIETAWSDPSSTLGEPSFEQLPSGDIAFHLAGGQEQPQAYDFTANLSTTLGAPGSPPAAMLTPVLITEDDQGAMTFVPGLSFHGESLAASGNRVWKGDEDGRLLESFVFQAGTLNPGTTVTLPLGNKLRPDISTRGYNENYAIASNGESVFAAAGKGEGKGKGFLFLSAANSTRPKARLVATKSWPTAQAASTDFVATSFGSHAEDVPRRVEIRQAKTNKLLKTLHADLVQAFFGFSLAITDDILWISSPHDDKVDGYNLTTFTQVISISSPTPVSGGVFGYSVAAHGPYLVIGEPSNVAPGAVWVFSADGHTLIKRLSSGLASGNDGFGCQLTTRNGRILVGSGLIDGQAGNYHREDPGGHRPVVLWNTPEANPVRLISSFRGSAVHDSGYAIALLDDCAVIAANSDYLGGVEYYAFPQSALAKASDATGTEPGATTAWPAAGSPDPVWSFAKSASNSIEVTVDLGTNPADPADLVMEWSTDLIHWHPLADLAGTTLSATGLTAITAGEGTLKVTLQPDPTGKTFFRLKSKD